ncbi:sulfotransferase 6B1-like [Dreissena polymorpha]|uniref:Sulfotransferase domain-containing protein n=1 Tax=Dreissena polymorpha TaxID=45954 RepID=A0A9D4J975_DREPO|nr:sulfotransferase 6B1-like [Dreissena polymorpha]XP_052224576.1 sulfotransferase 6B1-like [Dreissena polymorpha]XP_052224577.1 sulfotransferase 6B1-like [Dreissena polymorpha]KAH3800899.1 hypothetical protein DPMN_154542 [Dreissena polymorpha]
MEWKTSSVRDATGVGFDVIEHEELVSPANAKKIEPEQQLKDIKDFLYQDHDILLCSYPKTGSHWFNNIVHFLVHPGPVNDIMSVSPKNLDLLPVEMVAQQTPPRIILSHLGPSRLPTDHLQNGGKIILITRNPRDTMVANRYHVMKHEIFDRAEMEWGAFFKFWIDGKIPPGNYFNYFGSWKKFIADQKPNVLVVHYENMILNGVSELRRISDFLQVTNSDERLKQIQERCSLSTPQQVGTSGKVHGTPLKDKYGLNGHWKQHFTVAQSEEFDTVEAMHKESIFQI